MANQCNMMGSGIDFTAEADSIENYSNEEIFGDGFGDDFGWWGVRRQYQCEKGDPMCSTVPEPPPPKGGKGGSKIRY